MAPMIGPLFLYMAMIRRCRIIPRERQKTSRYYLLEVADGILCLGLRSFTGSTIGFTASIA